MTKDNCPLVSVVIPTFNRDKYVIESLESVFNQTYTSTEIIVVDDGSTDTTEEILRPYFSRIRYIKKENNGNAAARNTGLDYAKGEYVAFLDSDDIWLPEKLLKQIEFLENNPRCAFVYCGAYLIDENGREVGMRLLQKNEEPSFETLYEKNRIISLSFVVVRKMSLDQVGWFDEDLRQSPDYDLYLRLSRLFEYNCINELLCKYRVHSANISGNLEGRVKAHLHIFGKSEISGHMGLRGAIRRKAKIYYQVASVYYDEKKYLKASWKFLRSIFCDPYFGLTFKDKKFSNIRFQGLYKFFKVYYLFVYCLIIQIFKRD